MPTFGKCRACGASVMFISMESGRFMPVNPQARNYVFGGKEKLVTDAGKVVSNVRTIGVPGGDGYGYESHFATCPHADRFRKKN